MAMRLSLCVALLTISSCGDNKVPAVFEDAAVEPDAGLPPRMDAAIDAPPAPAMITLTGVATERDLSGTVPVAGVTIAAFANANETNPLASTTTNAAGQFTLPILTGGVALDGFLKASKAGLKDTYLYPATFVDGDLFGIPIQMLSQGNYDALSTLTQGDQLPQNGLIALQVLGAPPPAGQPVGGATVESQPPASAYHYNDATGTPSSLATSTHTDGVAYMFNVPVGGVIVSAAKPGALFAAHDLKAWPDALTTTFVQP
jgi:hypothetical protein